MNETTPSHLIERLDQLERGLWWWRVTGSLAVVMLGLILLLGAASPKVVDEIRVKRLVLVKEYDDGKLELTVTGFGLEWKDSKGFVLARLNPYMLDLAALSAQLNALPGGSAELILGSGGRGLHLRASKDSATLLLSSGYGGKQGRASLELDKGAPTLRLDDGFFGPSAVLGHSTLTDPSTNVETRRPAASLVLIDKDGKVMWKAP